MTSLANQTDDELGGPLSVLVRQKRDHERLEELLQQLEAAPPHEQPVVLRKLYRLVFPHAFAEEAVLWPALRKALPDGDQLTLAVEEEHQVVNELVAQLDRTPVDDPARPELVRRIVAWLRQDARDEEDLILPRLQAALGPAQLRRLGLTWELVRRTAPTRPHAVVSRRPPGNLLSGLPLSALDRSRDALDRAARTTPALAGPLRAVSGALALVAGAVEHLPPLRRGEDPSTSVTRPVRR